MSSTTTFKQLGIIDPILQVCAEEEFVIPTEIQEKSIPSVIAGKDVIGEAATGSGKTLAFASGIIQHVRRGKGVQALIITPTRELAQQVTDMIKSLSKYKPLKIFSIYGGVSINPQIRDLKKADVIVGTPGRLIDHIQRHTLKLKSVEILVLDECDRLLDMGFLPDVERIIRQLPSNRQTLLFSATISAEVSHLAQKYTDDPIEVSAEALVDPSLLHQYYHGPVHNSLKFSLLAHLLKENNNDGLSMIFCNTRRYVDFVSLNLKKAGIRNASIHGGLSQHERTKRLDKFQKQRINVLVATDVAARGLDIQGVKRIYNYDLPENRKQYIHRIGRTARAGNEGKAITLVAQRDSEKFFYLFSGQRNSIQKSKTPYVEKIQTEMIRNNRSNGGRKNFRSNRPKKRRVYSQDNSSRYSM
ncbi:MAG: DEAD/DEAH box helicase [Candidatus Hodarchaeales archaeon]|jgi:ATP-dependent RNA helicase DeaD